MEGRPQLALRANFAPGEAKENWAIIRALSGKLKSNLKFDNLLELRSQLVRDFPHIGRLNEITRSEWVKPVFTKFSKNIAFKAYVSDFYKTNPIARASITMNEMSKRSGAACKTIAAE